MSLIKKILGLVLLIIVLVAGVRLTKINQDIRKGATVADTVVSIYPSTSVVDLGKTIKVHVILNTGKNTDLLTGAEFKVSYGVGLKYSGNKILATDYSILNSTVDNGDGTLTFKMVSMGAEKGGVIDLMTIDFLTKASGSGELAVKEAKLMINGQSQMWEVKSYEKGTYQISPIGGVTPTIKPTIKPTPTEAIIKCSIRPGAPVVGCPDGYSCRCNCCPEPGMSGCAEYDTCEKNVPTVIPTIRPTIIPGTDGILKFKITFAGVNSVNSCTKNWNVDVTIMEKNNKINVFKNIPLTIGETTNNGLAVYSGQISLAGITNKNNLAIFIKSPRHVQTKYGVNGQSTFYGKAGGEITLDTNSITIPVLDFTKYSIMAGDVVSINGQGGDGVVNGLDFTYVKNEVIKRSEGNNILADLNGNCKLESQDLSLLMQTLREKADQIY